MLLDSAVLAVLLFVLAQLQGLLLRTATVSMPCAAASAAESIPLAGRLVGYCGAGIYEELLFRLMLLPLVAGLARLAGATPRVSWAAAILVTSLTFSAAHYDLVAPYGEPFALASFAFRFLAGAFFAVLFVYRGFGVAAGAHALYDMLVALW